MGVLYSALCDTFGFNGPIMFTLRATVPNCIVKLESWVMYIRTLYSVMQCDSVIYFDITVKSCYADYFFMFHCRTTYITQINTFSVFNKPLWFYQTVIHFCVLIDTPREKARYIQITLEQNPSLTT